MKTFRITFTSDPESGIYSANLVNAESAEQANAYFQTLGNYEIVGCTETNEEPKPGQPVHTVPEEEKATRTAEEITTTIMNAKADATTKIYKKVFDAEEDHKNVNKFLKAVIINFEDERGDIIVYNDNFGTRRKYADFTKGKKAAGLHPLQIVFAGVDIARVCHDRYINANDEICTF